MSNIFTCALHATYVDFTWILCGQHKLLGFVDQCVFEIFMIFSFKIFKVNIYFDPLLLDRACALVFLHVLKFWTIYHMLSYFCLLDCVTWYVRYKYTQSSAFFSNTIWIGYELLSSQAWHVVSFAPPRVNTQWNTLPHWVDVVIFNWSSINFSFQRRWSERWLRFPIY